MMRNADKGWERGLNGTLVLLAIAAALFLLSALMHFGAVPAQSAISFSGSSSAPPQTCALYGGSNYTDSWLGINLLVVLAGVLITSIVYVIAKLLPRAVSSRVTEMTKTEITQLFLSVVIIFVLLSFTTFACTTVNNLSTQLTGQSMDPFAYADYYTGNLTFNTGLTMLTNLYSYSIALSIASRIVTFASGITQSTVSQILNYTNTRVVTITPSFDPAIPLALLSDEYFVIFSPIIITSIGSLMVQYILIPLIKYTAFAVLLPVALILRSIAYAGYGGNGLRSAANTFLAIAIAAYLVYPLTIAFDSYVIHWIFTPCGASVSSAMCNPNFGYLNTAYTVTSVSPNSFFGGISGYTSNSLGVSIPIPTSLSNPLSPLYLVGQLGGVQSISLIFTAGGTTLNFVKLMSQYIFTAVIMFALNFAVTIGFAMSLTKALNNGIVGASNFWGSI